MEWNDGMEYEMEYGMEYGMDLPAKIQQQTATRPIHRTKAQTREGVDTRNSSLATCIHCVTKPQIIIHCPTCSR